MLVSISHLRVSSRAIILLTYLSLVFGIGSGFGLLRGSRRVRSGSGFGLIGSIFDLSQIHLAHTVTAGQQLLDTGLGGLHALSGVLIPDLIQTVVIGQVTKSSDYLVHRKSSYSRCRLHALGNRHHSDSVQILGKQGHAHDCEGLRHGGVVVTLSVEADQVGQTIGGVDQASLGKIAVTGVNIVQSNVFHGSGNDLATGDLCVRQQEHDLVAHEVLDVLETESRLNGDSSVTDVVIQVEDIGEANNLGAGAVHLLELIDDIALSHSQRTLPSRLVAGQRAGVQVGIETSGDIILKLEQESVIGHANGNIITVIFDRLDGNGLGILLDRHLRIGSFNDLSLGVGDFLTLTHSTICQRNGGLLGFQHSTGLLTNGTDNAENVPQMIPISGETGNEVNLTGSNGHISRHSQIFLSHNLFSFSEQLHVGGNSRLPLCAVLNFHDVFSGHSVVAITGRGLGGLLQSVSLDGFGIIFEELLLIGKNRSVVAVCHGLSGISRQFLGVTLSNELSLILRYGTLLFQLCQTLFHLGLFLSFLLLLLFVLGQQGVVLALPLGSFGIRLGIGTFQPFHLGGIIFVLETLQSGELLFGGHLVITLNLTGVDLCHRNYLLRFIRVFTHR
nr:MAG TPA: hypothetical protein [Caudoviricetes sp.]